MKAVNEHYYCLDCETGIYYRSVGLTNDREVIVYPKYVPEFFGDRGKEPIQYRGINYPTGSIRFLCSNIKWQSGNVGLKFSKKFHSFLPITNKERVKTYSARECLPLRLHGKGDLSLKLKKLIDLYVQNSTNLTYNDFGIDASMLVGMDRAGSDIDLIVYSHKKAWEAKRVSEILVKRNLINGPDENSEYFINRRKSYSPLMTKEEIIAWEKRKISFLYQGTKFSIMPKDLKQTDGDKYMHTNQYCAIRFKLNKDVVITDPGYLDLSNTDIGIVWGPKKIKVVRLITFLPSRMGVFLNKGDAIFSIGKLYKIVNKQGYALAQMPWDEEFTSYETRFVTKIEITKLDQLIQSFLRVEFDENGYTT